MVNVTERGKRLWGPAESAWLDLPYGCRTTDFGVAWR